MAENSQVDKTYEENWKIWLLSLRLELIDSSVFYGLLTNWGLFKNQKIFFECENIISDDNWLVIQV